MLGVFFVDRCVFGTLGASIAQLGERQTEDLKVPGSIPGRGIFCILSLRFTQHHFLHLTHTNHTHFVAAHTTLHHKDDNDNVVDSNEAICLSVATLQQHR